MPGPFPGVDPYLEDPRYWRGFHTGFITFATAALNAVLPPGFAANYEERVYVIPEERSLYPDIVVLQTRAPALRSGSGTALLEEGAPDGIVSAYTEEVREGYVEIRSAADWDTVITVVELLSPANKTNGAGRTEYLAKQRELIGSSTNLLEIDLLRRGLHTVAAPIERLRERGDWYALVCLHRASQPFDYAYWFNRLSAPLPAVRVPLSDGAEDVVLDLQSVYNSAYDAGPYHRRVDYSAAPPPPLSGEDAAWADDLLRQCGVRP